MNALPGAALRRRPRCVPGLDRDEAGFTLLELLIVIAIVGVLVSVSLPGFLGARQRAQERNAQANLHLALETANVVYIDTPDFSGFTPPLMAAAEPSLQFTTSSVAAPHQVAVSAGLGEYLGDPTTTGYLALAAAAGDGTCWYILQTNDTAPKYGTGPADASGSCSATTGAPLATYDAFPV